MRSYKSVTIRFYKYIHIPLVKSEPHWEKKEINLIEIIT